MTCLQCIARWGQEPSPYGDSELELVSYYKHRVFHTGESKITDVPWFWTEKVMKGE